MQAFSQAKVGKGRGLHAFSRAKVGKGRGLRALPLAKMGKGRGLHAFSLAKVRKGRGLHAFSQAKVGRGQGLHAFQQTNVSKGRGLHAFSRPWKARLDHFKVPNRETIVKRERGRHDWTISNSSGGQPGSSSRGRKSLSLSIIHIYICTIYNICVK